MNKTVALLALIGLGISSPSLASLENRGLLPFGEKEVMTGNAGVAGEESAGAVYYNPAGLAQAGHSRISVSGTTFVSNHQESPKFLRVDNTDVPYSQSGLDILPGALISTFKKGDWALAYFLTVPDAFKVKNKFTMDTPNTQSTVVQVVEHQELWGGVSAARYVSPKLSLGASLQFTQITRLQSFSVQIAIPSLANTGSVGTQYTDMSIFGMSATFGALYHASAVTTLGLRVQTPFARLGGKTKFYAGNQEVISGTLTSTQVSEDDIRTQYRMPLDITVGSRFKLGKSTSLLADLSYQLGSDFEVLEGSSSSLRVRTSATPRFSVGSLFQVSPKVELGAGFLYNPSSIHSLDGLEEGDSRANFWGFTGGIYWMPDNVRTGVSLFHLRANGEIIPSLDPTTRSPFNVRMTGGSITVSYLL